jgi:hypothetical protein
MQVSIGNPETIGPGTAGRLTRVDIVLLGGGH